MGRVLHETAGREKSKRKGKNRDEEEADETEITVEEVGRQIRKLKKRKASGRDEVQNET
jgi:hypothetical protein